MSVAGFRVISNWPPSDIIVYDRVDTKNLPPLARMWVNETRIIPITNNLAPMSEASESSTQLPTTLEPVTITTTTTASTPQPQQPAAISEPATPVQVSPIKQRIYIDGAIPPQLIASMTQQQQQPQQQQPNPPVEDEIVVEDYYWTRRTTTPPPETPKPYDISKFYKVPNPLSFPFRKEKVLTFCSKESAIRDASGMVIACGNDNEVWMPSRCPPHADCFMAADSTYRICCPIAA